jgi:hypothetical protein
MRISVADFQMLNSRTGEQENIVRVQELVVRQPLPSGMVKLNWDAALDIHNKKIGLGIIVRDDNGLFLAAYSKQQSIEVTPVVVETLADLML